MHVGTVKFTFIASTYITFTYSHAFRRLSSVPGPSSDSTTELWKKQQ